MIIFNERIPKILKIIDNPLFLTGIKKLEINHERKERLRTIRRSFSIGEEIQPKL